MVIHDQKIQISFLESLKEQQIPTSVFLANGIQLRGYIQDFDQYVIRLGNEHSHQLVFKHAISTIMPSKDKEKAEALA
jgi:host factor-I protein